MEIGFLPPEIHFRMGKLIKYGAVSWGCGGGGPLDGTAMTFRLRRRLCQSLDVPLISLQTEKFTYKKGSTDTRTHTHRRRRY